ncbi:MAG: S-layer homology domain-containing protein, partial [Defluviitaleaceae bacterium]|nr:S-layer homology domain-containing protein [Defluviitaleaceae bacterium]
SIPNPPNVFTLEIIIDRYSPPKRIFIDQVQVQDNAGNNQVYRLNPSQWDLDRGILPLPDDVYFRVLNYISSDLATNTANQNLINDILAQPDDALIVINYDTGANISADVFEAIRGTDRTIVLQQGNGIEWVFNGNDITYPKNIYANVQLSPLDQFTGSNSNLIEDIMQDAPAMVLSFADNGVLPGRATIRIIADFTFRSVIGIDNLYVYHFDRTNNKLVPIAANLNVSEVDGFLEFVIYHNTDFVITNGSIDGETQENDNDNDNENDITNDNDYSQNDINNDNNQNDIGNNQNNDQGNQNNAPPSNNRNNNFDSGSDSDSGSDNRTPAYTHSFINGNTFTLGTSNPLVFRVDRQYNQFVDVRVNDERLVRGEDFTVRAGSTRVTLLPEFLETLAPGRHRLTVGFTGGVRVNANFTVRAAADSEESEQLNETESYVYYEFYAYNDYVEGIEDADYSQAGDVNLLDQVVIPPTPPISPPNPPQFINPFADVNQADWFYNDVAFVYLLGLMTGTGNNQFSPNTNVTRAMVVQVLYNMQNRPSAAGMDIPFFDVAGGQWYTHAVAWANHNSIVSGFDDGSFRPNEYITRAHLSLILSNYARLTGMQLPSLRPYQNFTDDADIRNYAGEAIEQFFQAMIISGRPDDSFNPQGNATRAELATMLRGFLEVSE